jgi:hypothetical protein
LYLDRILAKKDFARLDEPAIRTTAAQAVGAHGQLWPEVQRRLSETAPGSNA